MTEFDVEEKVFFITGGANGLGKAFTETLLERSAKVFFVDIEKDTGNSVCTHFTSRFGQENVKFSHLDVTDRKQFEDVFQQAVTYFGHVDVMVNNAGILDESNAKRTMDVNFLGTVYGTEIATEHMRADKGGRGGRIINMSSLDGLEHDFKVPVYAGSKHAIRSFTTCLARQPSIDEIRVEYAVIFPCSASTRMRHINSTNIRFYSMLPQESDRRKSEMSASDMAASFFKLVSLENMNGGLMLVSQNKVSFVSLNYEESDQPINCQ